ncbi:hypothetical protein HQ865_24720 [Mucilaginibacter mali]|uniref:Uncharacterized protein n=1 Tax=Mucilaginibacter mali TaxID=2740462 RepID=A0A7D4UMF3_9SPHI|nr:hypothetical protein [Mucilaginibacter mali]QKJ32822.1 hypothetical protein HQ865_24720 [Mucilaginibacter mali]
MKKFYIGFNAVLILIVSSVANADVRTYLTLHLPQFYGALSTVALFGNALIYLIGQIPAAAAQTSRSLETASAEFFQKFKKYGFSIHIRTVKRRFLQWQMPPANAPVQRRRLKFFPQIFSVRWWRGETFSAQFVLGKEQGIYSEAFLDGFQTGMHSVFIEEELEDIKAIFSAKQVQVLQKFAFAASCAFEIINFLSIFAKITEKGSKEK